ncbi:hypothetical protein AD998_09170 [bacterium 336/3]|nr:hypothetical protein AD998_09170 [bacterium 336/3]
MLKKIGYTFILFIVIVLAYINMRLHMSTSLQNEEKTHKDVLLQLQFIEIQLKKKDLAVEMQMLYPEGYVFSNVLYGLTWAEIAQKSDKTSLIHQKAIQEILYAYNQVNTKYAQSIFPTSTKPQYGVFYAGWRNYLLGKLLEIQTYKNIKELEVFKQNCEEIAKAFQNSKSPFLESYQKASWPADSFVAMMSLHLHDKLFEPKYQELIKQLIVKVKMLLDKQTRLIPHSVDSSTGDKIEGARGSSMALMLLFLSEIEPTFAQEQFELFKKQFSQTILQLPSIREYPHESSGVGDVDSGPVIFGMSPVATIVSVGVFEKFGEYKTANSMFSCIETFGFSYSSKTEKKYLMGKMPIADIFIAWVRVQGTQKIVQENPFGSIFLFNTLCSGFIMLILIVLTRKRLKNILKK